MPSPTTATDGQAQSDKRLRKWPCHGQNGYSPHGLLIAWQRKWQPSSNPINSGNRAPTTALTVHATPPPQPPSPRTTGQKKKGRNNAPSCPQRKKNYPPPSPSPPPRSLQVHATSLVPVGEPESDLHPVLSGIVEPLLKACELSADGLEPSDAAVFSLNNVDVLREALAAHAVRICCFCWRGVG